MPAIIKIISAMVIWGSLGVFVRHIQLPSLETAFLRAIIAVTVLSLAWFVLKGKGANAIRKYLAVLLLSGAAIGLNWVMLFQAYRYTTITNATLTYYFAPVLVVLLSPLVLKERMSAHKVIAVLGGMAGLAVILGQQGTAAQSTYQHGLGITYGLIAAVLYAGIVLLNKRIQGQDEFLMTIIQLGAATLVLLPFVLVRNQLQIEPASVIYIVILGVVHTGVAYFLYFSGLKDIKAQNVALLSYLDPISAVLFSTLLLAEPIGLWQVLGGSLILISAYWGTKEKKVEQLVEVKS